MPGNDGKDEPNAPEIQGRYANHYRVGYNAYEFVIEFGQYYEGDNEESFHTRIVTSPLYARQMLALLADSLSRFEASFGPIRDDH